MRLLRTQILQYFCRLLFLFIRFLLHAIQSITKSGIVEGALANRRSLVFCCMQLKSTHYKGRHKRRAHITKAGINVEYTLQKQA
jgi:hypothetical protein